MKRIREAELPFITMGRRSRGREVVIRSSAGGPVADAIRPCHCPTAGTGICGGSVEVGFRILATAQGGRETVYVIHFHSAEDLRCGGCIIVST